MNWAKPCACDEDQKRRFHTTARTRLSSVGDGAAPSACSFDLRSNKAGIAISGEVTLHHERASVWVPPLSGSGCVEPGTAPAFFHD